MIYYFRFSKQDTTLEDRCAAIDRLTSGEVVASVAAQECSADHLLVRNWSRRSRFGLQLNSEPDDEAKLERKDKFEHDRIANHVVRKIYLQN